MITAKELVITAKELLEQVTFNIGGARFHMEFVFHNVNPQSKIIKDLNEIVGEPKKFTYCLQWQITVDDYRKGWADIFIYPIIEDDDV